MKTILLVDNDRFTRAVVICALAPFPGLRLLMASSYLEALWTLCEHEVELVIADLEMPEREGLDLLTYMANYHPKVPMLTMSSPKPLTMSSEGSLRWRGHLSKPLHPHALACRVRDALREAEKGEHRPLSLHDLLRVLSYERETCILRVKAGLRSGEFEISRGRIHHASCDTMATESAVRQMLGWESPWFRVERVASRPSVSLQGSSLAPGPMA